MRARFWVWHGNSPVRLALADGQRIVLQATGGPTDEGYSWEMAEYERYGDMVYCVRDTQSRDCDGRLDVHTELECRVDQLTAHDWEDNTKAGLIVHHWPKWHRVTSRQRDYSAEAMGY